MHLAACSSFVSLLLLSQCTSYDTISAVSNLQACELARFIVVNGTKYCNKHLFLYFFLYRLLEIFLYLILFEISKYSVLNLILEDRFSEICTSDLIRKFCFKHLQHTGIKEIPTFAYTHIKDIQTRVNHV